VKPAKSRCSQLTCAPAAPPPSCENAASGELERLEYQFNALSEKDRSRVGIMERSGPPSREEADLNEHEAEPLGFIPEAWPR
jgi:hypothetical protein